MEERLHSIKTKEMGCEHYQGLNPYNGHLKTHSGTNGGPPHMKKQKESVII